MLDVLIITYNEEANLPHCLASLRGLARRVFVVDSGSTDRTPELAHAGGAEVHPHPWEGYARQRNWGLKHLPLESDWTLILDADEQVTDALRDRLLAITSQPVDAVAENGYFINRLSYFMDQPIRHCGFYPSYHMRLIKRGRGQYEDRAVHEHIIVDNPVGYIAQPLLHNDRRGLEHYIAKHNRYSTLEAIQLFTEITTGRPDRSRGKVSPAARRHRWLKRHVMRWLPLVGLWRFLYMYVLRLGVLDGATGYCFSRFIAGYDGMVAMKLRYLLRRQSQTGDQTVYRALGEAAVQEDELIRVVQQSGPAEAMQRRDASSQRSDLPRRMEPEPSSWSFGEKVARAVWMLLGRPLFRASFHNWYTFRATILRCFGATIGKRVAIRPSVRIEIPWNLTVEDDASVGDYAILYSLGRIHIGARTIISQYAHLCAGTHDYTNHRFPLVRAPIVIGCDVWIGADAWVGPNVRIGDRCVLGARASAYKNMDSDKVYVGNPAYTIKDRVIR